MAFQSHSTGKSCPSNSHCHCHAEFLPNVCANGHWKLFQSSFQDSQVQRRNFRTVKDYSVLISKKMSQEVFLEESKKHSVMYSNQANRIWPTGFFSGNRKYKTGLVLHFSLNHSFPCTFSDVRKCEVLKPKLCSTLPESASHHVPDNPHPYSVLANSPGLLLQSLQTTPLEPHICNSGRD